MLQAPIDIPQSCQTDTERGKRMCRLVAMYMDRHKVSSKSLAGIPGVAYKNIKKRLEIGSVSWGELSILLRHLGINESQAIFAVYFCSDPEVYFTDVCDFMTRFATKVSHMLGEGMSALNGNFSPIKATICDAMAQKTTADVLEQQTLAIQRHQMRVIQMRVSDPQ
jgi:hypothetical protein